VADTGFDPLVSTEVPLLTRPRCGSQVIQIADTGLDVNSCWFNDTGGNVPFTTWSAAAFDNTKRKVRSERLHGDRRPR
jgi:hypothetical protein